jgi:clan AA aspartic protease
MGIVRTKILLANPKRPEFDPIEVDALVDTGAVHLCVPEHVANQLQLEELERREVTLTYGSRRLVAYSGPVQTSFRNRSCFTGAMVLGQEVLLGAIPMEDMDLIVRPATRDVIPNPTNPNIPGSIAMGVRRERRAAEPPAQDR